MSIIETIILFVIGFLGGVGLAQWEQEKEQKRKKKRKDLY